MPTQTVLKEKLGIRVLSTQELGEVSGAVLLIATDEPPMVDTGKGNRWEMLARDPPGNVFDIAQLGIALERS